MEVDSCFENPLHSCPRDFVKPLSLVMDDHGSLPHPRSSGLRVSTKSKAPSPPGLKDPDSPGFSRWYPGNSHLNMDQKENLIDQDLSLTVVLPGGVEKITTVHGSKPLMDLLVTLCAKYHLNPSGHTLELVTTNRNNIKLKPNALIGTLDAEKIILKPKGEDKNKKLSPQMPEATVRMVINYKKTQKTILRVNPRVPLTELLPAICEKCEFEVETTVLLKDVQSLSPLDLSCSLNDYAIREVYARDTKGQTASPVCPSSPSHAGTVVPGKDKNQKEKENKGLFSKFRKSKKNSEQATTASAPASPVLVIKPRPLSMALPGTDLPPLSSPSSPTDVPKKRRAPQPPLLVSQSFSSEFSPRRRIHSEPNYPPDSDQMAGLSRGSSAESSLKRTKRKAPAPPTSQSPVVHDSVGADESTGGAAAANTLEEIMEQEETTPSVMPATANASDTQGEDHNISTSADVSLHSPSPDTEMLNTVTMEAIEEDQSPGLSSDGKYELCQVQSTAADAVTLSDVTTAAGTASPEPEHRNGGLCQVENVTQQPVCGDSASESTAGDCGTIASSSLSQPAMQEADAQAPVQANTETPREQNGRLESPVAISTSCPVGEDAEVQTHLTPLTVPPQQHADEVPSTVPSLEPPGKKDMATLTDELNPPDLEKPASSHVSGTSCQDSTPSSPATTKAPTIYAADSEPKPKPSNELTRDYIPKVGMTTYTIVPQKSLEKLRYFEVALTLEAPPAAPEETLDIGSLHVEESAALSEQMGESKENTELHPTVPRKDLLISTATTQDTVNRSTPDSTHPSSPDGSLRADDKISSFVDVASQTAAEVKEMKIPPATKPKPGSFRLAQHKKTPGYYVTSAADKSSSASPGPGQREAPGSTLSAMSPPLPPSPPVQCREETTGATNIQLSPKEDDKNVATRMTRQSSLPCKEPSLGLSLEKLRSFASPRPYSPATPTRFAQAVSSAVKRSQSLSHGPRSPRTPPFSPISSRPQVIDTKGLSKLKDGGNTEADGDKGSILLGAEGEAPSFTEAVKLEGESSP
ncbi:cordon-bleu protein-like 1 isoform X1 [Solea senegalensis]|uniref:Cordon-bleu protein-like 1 isoform X1 n=3 Tax=Solea senegalensis TaxID=28829 RepID=A0AAV6RCT1_SOLSE|nr:cordon-bleu protein-like 1b isoform X2 [Solea senegalensis]KAG7503153.1 cordon-bleu protein-like 1 isoform X1 [Solea senegalensis]